MEQIKGFVEHIIYRNEENGYTVFSMDAGDGVTCVGHFPPFREGEALELTGEFVTHPLYGRQFRATSFSLLAPEDEDSIRRYLGSGVIRGIGQGLADRIVDRFGKDTLRVIEREPERLSEVRGVSERMAMEIGAQAEEKKQLREAMIYLFRYGVSSAMAVRIYQTYGDRMYRILQENPYQLAEDVEGFGFQKADELAARIGLQKDSEFRIRCGILYVMGQASGEGHVYLPHALLVERSAELLGVAPEEILEQIPNLAMEQKLVVQRKGEDVRCYTREDYYTELACAKLLVELSGPMGDPEQERGDAALFEKLTFLCQREEIQPEEHQLEAVAASVRNSLLILTGGPGTGKTTAIRLLIHYYLSEGKKVALAAPTGRAARRMAEATGYEAKTIHRLLELSGQLPGKGRNASFERNEDHPLEADVIVLDEMSMVDMNLFYAFLKAAPPGVRLVLVGDENQLPSVGAGQVLRDLISCGCFPVVRLERIFRQARQSDIVMCAHRINRGEELSLDNRSRDFFFLERSQVQVIYKHLVQLVSQKLPPYIHGTAFDVQVLTPMRKGSLGAETLNGVLQRSLNPPSPGKREIHSGKTVFREGDKVMQTRNNYQMEWDVVSSYGIVVDKGKGIFNGDMGIVRSIDPAERSMVVEFDEGRRTVCDAAAMEELELAYAITIHKSQGSEYPAVVMPLLGGPRLLFNRNLLYTGVTRARGCVTILGSRRVVSGMIANGDVARRYTSLQERIRELKGESF